MGLQVGLVGLPNVGKSTLFNALSRAGALAANYPFATIDANVGVVAVPDERLDRVAELAGSSRTVPTTIEFVDIAGLVAGASTGEGLGNQFLAHIREVDAICHVVRCFDDDDVVHVSGAVDPVGDVDIVEAELIIKDLETVEKRLERITRVARSGDTAAADEAGVLGRLRDHLAAGEPARRFEHAAVHADLVRDLFLLSAKAVVYAANVGEDDLPGGGPLVEPLRKLAAEQEAEVVVVCAQVEAELPELPEPEQREYLGALGLERSGLERLVHAAYRLLSLVTFFTADDKEARAVTVRRATRAQRAAREIHSDMERGFIRAEVISYEDYVTYGSESAVRDAGRLRLEGKGYPVADGDVIRFRFAV
ncbi:MAG: redox-regulated ATPase YchF [Actinobacteria bacterium]|nr:redox-regulated ATPase YchF [Actinomycetota bacterium]